MKNNEDIQLNNSIPMRFMPIPFMDGIEEICRDLKTRTEKGSITYGVEILDECCEYIRPGTVTLIMATPNTGKSLIAQQIAVNIAKQGQNVIFSSCEMSAGLLMERELKKIAGVTTYQLVEGYKKSPDGINKMLNSFMQDKNYDYIQRIQVQDIGGIHIDDLLKIYDMNPDCKYFIVDYIQRVKGDGNTEYEQLKDVSYKLQIYAMENKKSIMVCAQIPKTNENECRSAKDSSVNFQMLKAKGAGNMEEDAHIGIKMAEQLEGNQRYVLINLSKNKYGSKKFVTYKYQITPRLEFKLIAREV